VAHPDRCAVPSCLDETKGGGSMGTMTTLYGGADPRELPAYTIQDAARYLHLPPSTLRAWVRGQGDNFKAVIALPDPQRGELSFLNLVEAHVLNAIRREHEISLQKTRKSLELLETKLGSKRPLASEVFFTDGIDLFVERLGQLHTVSRSGQLAIKEILKEHLRRIEFEHGLAVRLYPFTRRPGLGEPKAVVIDPMISFGRPTISTTGVPTGVIAQRFDAGDSVDDLARDYDLAPDVVEEALRCERLAAA
jgi:uncharacterized protein (DUF433 family)